MAAQMVVCHPSKSGIFSRSVRSLLGLAALPLPATPLTLEAHIDAEYLTDGQANALMELGFEIDGFHKFMPSHFREHFTLKFKVDRTDPDSVRYHRAIVQAAVSGAKEILSVGEGEAYIEVESYTAKCRRFWDKVLVEVGWRAAFPLAPGELVNINPPRTAAESAMCGWPLQVEKRADIHVKIAKSGLQQLGHEGMIEALVSAGFYHVITWSPNDVCTAQFSDVADARNVFQRLDTFLSYHGGATEMTLEYATELWRTLHRRETGDRLCELPPLVIGLASAEVPRSD